MQQVSVLGCGAMGTCLVNHLAQNVVAMDEYKSDILWYVRDEECFGERLVDVIKVNRENPKYAPKIKICDNVVVCGDAAEVARASDIIVFVYSTRHVNEILQYINGHLKPNVVFISFSKGLLVSEPHASVPDQVIRLVSEEIRRVVQAKCVVVSGGVNARGLSSGDFAEATIGSPDPNLSKQAKHLLESPNLYLTCTPDMTTVEVCGALKNILAVAAGIVDGLGLGANTKSAVIRLGLYEIGQFCKSMYSKYGMIHKSDEVPKHGDDLDFFNLVIGRMLADPKYEALTLDEIEKYLNPDLTASGPDCAHKIHAHLQALKVTEDYPLFTAVHLICARRASADDLIPMLKCHPAHK